MYSCQFQKHTILISFDNHNKDKIYRFFRNVHMQFIDLNYTIWLFHHSYKLQNH